MPAAPTDHRAPSWSQMLRESSLRQQRIALARLVAAPGLPTGVVDDDGKRRQRRSARGVYNTGGQS